MKRQWTIDELVDHWTLLPADMAVLANKTGATRLGFALLLKYFQFEGRFPHHPRDVPPAAVIHVARQLDLPAELYLQYRGEGRTIEYHRAQIREVLGFHPATERDSHRLTAWLQAEILPYERSLDRLIAAVYTQCRTWHVEPPTPKQIDRLVRTALHAYDAAFCMQIAHHLTAETCAALDALLEPVQDTTTGIDSEPGGRARIHDLKADPGRLSVDTAHTELAKLAQLRALALPDDLFGVVSPKTVHSYRQRVAAESPYELRRHPAPLRATLLAAWATERIAEVTDTLVDLLIDMIHLIGGRAERKVEKVLVAEVKRVTGKQTLLFQLAEASLAHPDGFMGGQGQGRREVTT